MISEAFDAILKSKEEIKKFVTYAENVKTEDDLIKLCEKYLNHKGRIVMEAKVIETKTEIDEDDPCLTPRIVPVPPSIETMFISRELYDVDAAAFTSGNYGSYEKYIKTDMVKELAIELQKQGFIKFNSTQNFRVDAYRQSKTIVGTIQVVKDKTP
jgi:adenine-specific DNA methylase